MSAKVESEPVLPTFQESGCPSSSSSTDAAISLSNLSELSPIPSKSTSAHSLGLFGNKSSSLSSTASKSSSIQRFKLFGN